MFKTILLGAMQSNHSLLLGWKKCCFLRARSFLSDILFWRCENLAASDGASLHYHTVLRSMTPLPTIPGAEKYQSAAAEQQQDKHIAVKTPAAVRPGRTTSESKERLRSSRKGRSWRDLWRGSGETDWRSRIDMTGLMAVSLFWTVAAEQLGPRGLQVTGWTLSYPPRHTPSLNAASAVATLQPPLRRRTDFRERTHLHHLYRV